MSSECCVRSAGSLPANSTLRTTNSALCLPKHTSEQSRGGDSQHQEQNEDGDGRAPGGSRTNFVATFTQSCCRQPQAIKRKHTNRRGHHEQNRMVLRGDQQTEVVVHQTLLPEQRMNVVW